MVRIPDFTAPGPIMEELKERGFPGFRPSRHYQLVCDLRAQFDLDAVVHINFRYGRKHHKVEIIDAGQKTLDEMSRIITRLFQIDPWTLQVMRTDLAADIEGVPVPWFRDHAYVNRKQFSSRIEKSFEQELQFVAMGSALAQTIYAGKRPQMFRIYDKLAEWRIQLRKIERDCNRSNKRMEAMELSEEARYYRQRIAPTFREYCRRFGYEFHPGKILTRVERQIGGTRIPPEFSKLGDLRYAHELNPFTALKVVPGERFQLLNSPPMDVSIRNWLAAIGFETLKEHHGSAQLARQIVVRHGNNNGRRILESLARCTPDTRDSVTLEQIQESDLRFVPVNVVHHIDSRASAMKKQISHLFVLVLGIGAIGIPLGIRNLLPLLYRDTSSIVSRFCSSSDGSLPRSTKNSSMSTSAIMRKLRIEDVCSQFGYSAGRRCSLN